MGYMATPVPLHGLAIFLTLEYTRDDWYGNVLVCFLGYLAESTKLSSRDGDGTKLCCAAGWGKMHGRRGGKCSFQGATRQGCRAGGWPRIFFLGISVCPGSTFRYRNVLSRQTARPGRFPPPGGTFRDPGGLFKVCRREEKARAEVLRAGFLVQKAMVMESFTVRGSPRKAVPLAPMPPDQPLPVYSEFQ